MNKIRRTAKRRRKERKTDYKARLRLLKSEKPRIVIRKTNRYIIGQIVTSEVAQDKIILGVNSRELLKHGWPENLKGSLKGNSAAYLTGYLLGKKSAVKEGILDIGLQRNTHKSKIYYFLKGLVDSGFKIPHSEKAIPDDKTLEKDEKTGKLINQLKKEIAK